MKNYDRVKIVTTKKCEEKITQELRDCEGEVISSQNFTLLGEELVRMMIKINILDLRALLNNNNILSFDFANGYQGLTNKK